MLDIFATSSSDAIPIYLLTSGSLSDWLEHQTSVTRAWIEANGFEAREGQLLIIPNERNSPGHVVFGYDPENRVTPYPFASLSNALPEGDYTLEAVGFDLDPAHAALSWAMGTYTFDRYKNKKTEKSWPRLIVKDDYNTHEMSTIAMSVALVRNLVNTPANDMGPDELQKAMQELADAFQAKMAVTLGEQLLTDNFPLIHAVGRASNRAPRLLDLTWGDADAPKVTLIGKGVCFDSGGLNIKPGRSMELMKKDMGGAAHVLGLASIIMSTGLPIRLRVLIPAVENAISGNAFRPGDVLPSRDGMSVEIENTDAEGRLVLADALTLADEENPDILIDMATLTGAARVALGADIPPFYTNDEALAANLALASKELIDPIWRLPLWPGYDGSLKGKVADVSHTGDSGMAGSITAALFLQRFVKTAASWVHFDVYAWNPKPRPGQPVGGEAQGIRALYEVIKTRYPRA